LCSTHPWFASTVCVASQARFAERQVEAATSGKRGRLALCLSNCCCKALWKNRPVPPDPSRMCENRKLHFLKKRIFFDHYLLKIFQTKCPSSAGFEKKRSSLQTRACVVGCNGFREKLNLNLYGFVIVGTSLVVLSMPVNSYLCNLTWAGPGCVAQWISNMPQEQKTRVRISPGSRV
jgi:hypothetical protein